jgi:PAS domain S-box-containing protein
VIERGNQLFVLEDWIQQFIQLVRDTRDEMRQQHESEMQESEMLKQAIMETALDSIITIDLQGCIIEFNHTAELTFGCDRDQVMGRLFSSLILDSSSGRQFNRLLQQVLEVGAASAELRHEMVALKAQWEPFPVELAIKPIRLKNRTAFTVYLHDISSRRRAEHEIRSLARFASESPNPLLRVNRPGVITYANAASNHLLDYWGCTRSQTLPLYWQNRVVDILTSGEVWRTQLICGNHVYSLLFAPVQDQGYVNLYGRDITGERQAEQLAREHQQELVHVCRLSTLGEMATGLAHELNQPLAAIANYANGCIRRLQASDTEAEDIRYALGQISAQSSRAGEIIRRLRGMVGKQPPIRAVSDINQLVREVCFFVEFEARKAGVVIEQELSLTPLPSKIDLVQIEQVLLNLVRNALDALLDVPEQERRLIIQTVMHGRDWVQVRVLDSGPGINEVAMAHLFEPFFTTKASGMGMGLAISQTIVQDHNGSITAGRSEPEGTCFSVMLPSYGKSDGE